MKKYYLVWNESTNYTAYKHETFESALAESKRLASIYSDQSFVVLEPITLARKNSVIIRKFENAPQEIDDEIPF